MGNEEKDVLVKVTPEMKLAAENAKLAMSRKKKKRHFHFNDQLARALNVHYGFPEDYRGPIGGFDKKNPGAMGKFGEGKEIVIPIQRSK